MLDSDDFLHYQHQQLSDEDQWTTLLKGKGANTSNSIPQATAFRIPPLSTIHPSANSSSSNSSANEVSKLHQWILSPTINSMDSIHSPPSSPPSTRASSVV